MVKRYLLLFLLITSTVFANAQVSYSFSVGNAGYVPLVNGTSPALVSPFPGGYEPSDEGYANAVPIGFTFKYNGINYTTVNINANGFISLGNPFIADPNEAFYYDSLSLGPLTQTDVRPLIAPFWADLDLGLESNLSYAVTGTAPNRVMTIEWADAMWDYSATAPVLSFQCKLFESGVIEFVYQAANGTPADPKAAIGLTATGTGPGNFLSVSEASLAATASSTVESKIFSVPPTGLMFQFTPLSCLPPTNLNLTNVTATSATINWTAVAGATGYQYFVSQTQGAPTGAGTPTTGTSANIALSPGVNYVYVRTNCGGSTFSLWGTKAVVPCTTNTSPTNGSTNVPIPPNISWNAVPNATGYTIMLSSDGGVTYDNLGTLPSSMTSVDLPGTTGGTTYYFYVRPVGGDDTASVSCVTNAFSFTTVSGPTNDSICNAIPLSLNGPSDCQNTAAASVEGNEPALSCSTPNNTVWYTYTPTASGPVGIVMKAPAGSTTPLDGWVGIFTASGTCPNTTLTQAFDCYTADITTDSVLITTDALIAGTTYYIMIDGFLGASGDFCINLVNPPAAPANDNICNAIPLVLDGPSDCQNTTTATVESNEPALTCSTPNNTVWYSYTATTAGPVLIKMKNPGSATPLDGWVGLFTSTGTCPSVTLTQAFDCYPADLITEDSVVFATDALTAGTTYYIMIDGYLGATGDFCVSILTAPAAPACATLITPSNNATNVVAPNTTFTWSSVANATGYNVLLGTTNPPTVLGTIPDTTVTITGLAYNTTYYWSIEPTVSGVPATGCSVFSFTTMAKPAPPANDECTGAVALNGVTPITGTTVSATESLPAVPCNGFTGDADDDVWYSFTTNNAGDVTINLTTTDATFDAVIEAFSGTCGALNSLGCSDTTSGGGDEGYTFTNLTANTTYYFRVYSWDDSTTSGAFTINMSGTALPVTFATFRGEKAGARNILSWTTATEQNSRGFELQRSANGEEFSTLGFVPTKALNGNSSTTLSYQLNDEKPLTGNGYYRVKQVDKDGRTTLSNIIMLKGARSNAIVLSSVYPNPAKAQLKIVLTAPTVDKIKLVVTDLAGKIVMQQATTVISGDNNLVLNVAGLPSGSYLIKAVCANACESAISKFVKD